MLIRKLQCNYMNNPMGFDFVRPMLSWVVEAEGRNKCQSAYRLQVADAADFAGILMDTQKVESDQSVGYRLEMPLEPCKRYFWRVKVWDEAGAESDYSEPAYFETARYGREWKADWIGRSSEVPQLRKGFTVEKKVVRARAYASGVGLYRLFLNGAMASDELLTPNFNAYDQWLQYQTYDVTDMIVPGLNTVGAWLANGYYKGRVNWPNMGERRNIYGDTLGFIMELDMEYEDGSCETILTDTSWEAMDSPYRRAEIYDGEVFDAREWAADWCAKGDGNGERASLVAIDKALLQARRSLPVRSMHTLPVKEKIVTPSGELVFDFGQNFAGIIRICVDVPEGTEILFQFGEVLDRDGNFYRDNMRTALAELRYISDGTAREYAPNFTFFGFRYVRVTGWDVKPEEITAEAIYSCMEPTGEFECSDARVNRLFLNALWSQRSNFVDVPTDCPQRDERMGWTGDAQVFSPTACMNMSCDPFFRKYLYDLALEQKKSGFVPVVVPFILRNSGVWEFPTTGWGDAAVIIPWNLYLYYGDKAVLEDQYPSMKAWVEYIRAQDTEGKNLYEGFHLGDWLAQDTKDPDNFFGLTPPTLVATAYYAWSAEHLAKAARVLGMKDEAAEYEQLAAKVREAFRNEFVSPNGRVATETQTAYLVALHMNMLTPAQKENAIRHLAERIQIDKMHLTTGFIGTPILCPTLSDCGLNEYAYSLLLAEGYPSWLYAVEKGATTIWERWNSIRPDGTMGAVNMNSLNHYSLGAIAEWMYRYAAGLNPSEEGAGYRRCVVAPRVHEMMSCARGSIETPYGTLASSWTLEDGVLKLEVRIPFNSTAEIRLPDSEGCVVLENGVEIAACAEDAVLNRGSGVWQYEYRPTGRTITKKIGDQQMPSF